MTVQNEISSVRAPGNGVAVRFSFSPMVILQPEDMKVEIVRADGSIEEKLSGTGADQYRLEVSQYPGTGSVVYPADEATPLATGEFIVMSREMEYLQPIELENQGGYFPQTQETGFDRSVMLAQQNQRAVGVSIRIPEAESGVVNVELPSTPDRVNQYITFDASGNAKMTDILPIGPSIPDLPAAPDVDPVADLLIIYNASATEDQKVSPDKVVEAATGLKVLDPVSTWVVNFHKDQNETPGNETQFFRQEVTRQAGAGSVAVDTIWSYVTFEGNPADPTNLGAKPGQFLDLLWTYESGIGPTLPWVFSTSARVGCKQEETFGGGFVMYGGNILATAGCTTSIWWDNPVVRNQIRVADEYGPGLDGITEIVPTVGAMYGREANVDRSSAWGPDEPFSQQSLILDANVKGGGELTYAVHATAGAYRESRAFSGYPVGVAGTNTLVFPAAASWATSTAYATGDLARDVEVFPNLVYRCAVANTSGAGTFAQDRTANPTHWVLRGDDDEYVDGIIALGATTFWDLSQVVFEESFDGSGHGVQILTAGPSSFNVGTRTLTLASNLPETYDGTKRVSVIHRYNDSGQIRFVGRPVAGAMNRFLGVPFDSASEQRSHVRATGKHNGPIMDYSQATMRNKEFVGLPRQDSDWWSKNTGGVEVRFGTDSAITGGQSPFAWELGALNSDGNRVSYCAIQLINLSNTALAHGGGFRMRAYDLGAPVDIVQGLVFSSVPTLTPVTDNTVELGRAGVGRFKDIHTALINGAPPGSGGGGSGVVQIDIYLTGAEASASTGAGKATWVPRNDFSVASVHAYATDAPTGGPMTVDIHDDGVSIMAANKLDILADANDDDGTATVSAASIAANSVVTFDIDLVGLTNPGGGVTVQVTGTWA